MGGFQVLTQIGEFLIRDVDTYDFKQGIYDILKSYLPLKNLNFYVYDSVTSTLRDVVENYCIIEGHEEYNIINFRTETFQKLKIDNYVINKSAINIFDIPEDSGIEVETLYIPMIRNEKVKGMLEYEFEANTVLDSKCLTLLRLISLQVSLKLQNIILNEQSRVNVEFHDSMKNIAKLIETQYELSYIVPLIGEMLDRFISDHLIYIFLKQNDVFNLIWPKACNDNRIFEVLEKITPESTYLLTAENKIGAFPLVSDNEVIGCIVARSTLEKLSNRDIGFLEQLTRQSAITINRANTYSKVLQYATIDALTNLNNRRQFEVRLKQEIAIAKRLDAPLCAMMIDIDFFKKFNDTYGHAIGDEVLRVVANIIKTTVRESDIPSRYGGEEFAVLLPFTNTSEAYVVGERLRLAVENAVIKLDNEFKTNENLKVTISMGIAELNSTESGEELFKRADKALYEAKENGRNKVVVYNE